MAGKGQAPVLGARFEKALAYAAGKHRRQERKGTGVPYVSHLLAVASLVIEHGGDEDEAIAALLHDAVEDGHATNDRIRKDFGARVADIVRACSDTEEQPKPPWEARKRAFIEEMRGADRSTLLVAAADKLHNARAILSDYRVCGDELWARFSASRERVLWYYDELAKTFRAAAGPPPPRDGYARLVDELERTVAEIHRLCRGAPRDVGTPGTK